ncbi:MAG: hypothetical protein A2X64_03660 [Ignavibacteria bacterium GWF2_33_9]|nr:MAG: hypothetical protein A2X64_03660 [Ignavibacteria bacterium GWF2_33_9]
MYKSFVFIFAFFLTIAAYAQPKIEIEGGTTFDWGKSNPAKSPLKTTIKIKNVGNEILKIKEVKPGCGCTNAPLDKYDIQPNDFASMEVSLNITSYTGDITKSIRISSNDPQNGDTYVFLKTNVFRPLIAEPSVYLGKSIININEEVTFEFKLKNQTDKPIKILSYDISPEEAVSSIMKNEIVAPNSSKAFTIKATSKTVGRLNGQLKIHTDIKDVPDMTIYFYGNVVTDEGNRIPR